ncbi:MAG: polysaccharide biosynthesis protein [Ruminococcaceae bacterium]|nr:polysaccharide biosynthesis protein [Oscillospiraceae bacterium]
MINKVIDKYKSIPAAAKASLWFAICSVIQKGISLITVPLFTRLLTQEQYGEFSVFQSWYQLVSIFATLSLSAGVFFNGMTKYPKDRDKYMSTMQGLSTVVTLLLFCVYLPFREIINELTGLSTLLVVTIFVECLAAPALAFWSTRQRYEFKYVALVIVTIGVAVLSPALGLIAVNLTEEKGLARILSAALVNVGVGFFFYVLNIKRGKKLFSKEYWTFALKFNIPLIPHYLSSMVLSQSNRIMIERMFSETEVAIYSVAYSFSMIMNIVTQSINSSFVPWTYRKLKDNDIAPLKQYTTLLLLAVASISLLPVLVAPELMWIIAPPEYAEGVWIIPPLSTSVFFIFLYNLFANVEFYFEKTKFVMVASVIGAIANVGLNLILMPRFGYLAAGYVTLICYMLFAFAHYIFMRKVCKDKLSVKSVYNDKFIFLITLVYLVCMAIAMCLYNFVIIRYAILVIAFIVLIIKRNFVINLIKNVKKKD